MSDYIEITEEEFKRWNYEQGYSYGQMGVQLAQLKPIQEKAGLQLGEFIISTSITRDIDTKEKAHLALSAPEGTELILQKIEQGKIYRRSVTL